MEACELDQESRHRAQHQVYADDPARCVRASESPVQEREHGELGKHFIDLRGMQRHAERDAGKLGSLGIAKGYRPGKIALVAPAASGGETSDAPDRVPERDSRRERVESREQRKPVVADIKDRDHDREHQSSLPDSGGLQRLERKNRRLLRIVPIENDHQDLRAQEAAQRAVNREIGYEFGCESVSPRKSHGDPKAREKPQRDQDSICGQEETSDRDELGEQSTFRLSDADRPRRFCWTPLSLTLSDDEHSQGEQRWITLGLSSSGGPLVVIHTLNETGPSSALVRLISARRATSPKCDTLSKYPHED